MTGGSPTESCDAERARSDRSGGSRVFTILCSDVNVSALTILKTVPTPRLRGGCAAKHASRPCTRANHDASSKPSGSLSRAVNIGRIAAAFEVSYDVGGRPCRVPIVEVTQRRMTDRMDRLFERLR